MHPPQCFLPLWPQCSTQKGRPVAHINTHGTPEFPDTHNWHLLLLLSIAAKVLVPSCPFGTDFWHVRWQHWVSLTGRPWHPWVPFWPAPALRVPSRPDQPGKRLDNRRAKIWGPQNFIWLEMAKETLC